MRHRTFRQFVDAGILERELSPELAAEAERDAKLSQELAQVIREKAILPWLAEHPYIDWTCTVPAVLSVAAIEAMAGCHGTTPDDFAEMAREIAKLCEPQARTIGERAREQMRRKRDQS